MAFGIGSFQNIVDVGWKSSGGCASWPSYVVVTLSMLKKGGGLLTNDWANETVEFSYELCNGNQTTEVDALGGNVSRKISSASFNVRVVEDLFYLAYYPENDGPAFMGDGQGWYLEPVSGGALTFNQNLMPVTGDGSSFGGGTDIRFPFGLTNFAHADGTDLNIPSPFEIGGAPFKSGTNFSVFMWLSTLGSGLCYNPLDAPKGNLVYPITGYAKALETQLDALPLNAKYNGRDMTLVGMRTSMETSQYAGLELSTYCELLYLVPPPLNP